MFNFSYFCLFSSKISFLYTSISFSFRYKVRNISSSIIIPFVFISFLSLIKHSMQYFRSNSKFSFVFFSVSSSLVLKYSKHEENLISNSFIIFLKLSNIFNFKFDLKFTQSIYLDNLESALNKAEFEKMLFMSNWAGAK